METKSTFGVGDSVTWTSQAAGYKRTKTGIVEEVVPAKAMPNRERFVQLYRGAGLGGFRDHVSYVVRVPGKTAKSASTLYWPRVSALKPSSAHTAEADPRPVPWPMSKAGPPVIPPWPLDAKKSDVDANATRTDADCTGLKD